MRAFGAQNAVYAAADGIWPLYFALLDRVQFPTNLINGCIRIRTNDGDLSPPYYLFSVDRRVLPLNPWRSGTIYILPRDPFVAEPSFMLNDVTIETAQLACPVSVRPLAKLVVQPHDFPFLTQVQTHDDEDFSRYVAALQTASPWPAVRTEGAIDEYKPGVEQTGMLAYMLVRNMRPNKSSYCVKRRNCGDPAQKKIHMLSYSLFMWGYSCLRPLLFAA